MNNKGFTLIELLVVVLIIGILAAVALPQYTKAVEKSRTAEAMQVLGDLATAESIYYMAQNSFVETVTDTNLAKFDLTFPGYVAECGSGKVKAIETGSYCITLAKEGTDSVKATATRKNGAYSGGTLTITVEPSGKITRGGSFADGSDSKPILAPQWKN